MRGESVDNTQIFWLPYTWEFDELPYYFIKAESDVVFEDLEFRGVRTYTFMDLGGAPGSKNIILRRLCIIFNPYAGHALYHATKLGRKVID